MRVSKFGIKKDNRLISRYVKT